MRLASVILPGCLLLASGCVRETPTRLEDRSLGIAAVFPGQPRMHKFSEPTPFGEMEWFSTTYETPGRLDRSFFIDVGNLPDGDRGGATESAVLATLKGFLQRKMGTLDIADVPGGFRYTATLPNGAYAEGIALVKRGRIHRCQGTVAKPDDPQLKAFLDSFTVQP
jgi:hypothetical protein